ncbi:hypothetical protein GCM10022289_44930 [Pedobacter jeongneungensis]|uniref:KAP NTPase domain-containing protein n=2 Tax=Pedobacter jeongneungensis TaxID=947309 RepID=A0ABP8BQ20_9SPHI
MKELSDDLGTGEKKLIVVFDNMDRLPPDKVKILWSSINTFFSDFSFDHISVIIPFDTAHILAAFGNSDDVAGQFISKTFRVIFRVAQPVLTDWQAFFTLKFENAFGSGYGSELIVLKTIFDLATPSITPRDIIAFINEMVSVSLVLGDEVGLRYIGLFCLNKKEILADPARIIEELPFIERFKTVFRDDDQIQDSLAAIAYNVPKESARQIILKREIQLAIREENQERFEALTGQKHFSDMLEQISMIDELPISAFIQLCEGLPGRTEKISAAESTEFWDRLNRYYIKAPQNTQEFTIANRILMDRCSVEHKLQHASYFAKRMNLMDNFLGDKYYHSLNKFDEFSRDGGLGISIHDHLLDKDMEAEDFVLFVTAGGGLEPDFKVSTDVGKLNEYLIDAVSKGRKVDPVIGEIQESYDLKATVEYLTAQMVAVDNKITYDNLVNVVYLLHAMTPDLLLPRLPDTVLKIFLEHTDQKEETFLELAAMRLSRGKSYAYEGIAVESFLEISGDDDTDFVAQVAKRFEKYGNYGTGLLFAGKWKNNLLTGVMQNITINHYGTSRMNIAEVLPRFTEIGTAFDLDLDIFIDRLNGWSRFLPDNISKETIRAKVGDVGFYRKAVNSKNKLSRYMIKTYKDSLQDISEEAWAEVIINKDSTLSNVLTFIESGQLKSLPVNCVLAFKRLISEFAAGDYDDISEADFLILKKSISNARLKTVLKNIRDRFLTDLMITTRQSLFFFGMFIDNADLSDRPADAIRRLFIPMLSHPESLDLLLVYSEDVISIVLAGGVEGLSFVEELKGLDSADLRINHLMDRLRLSDAESKKTKTSKSKKKQNET